MALIAAGTIGNQTEAEDIVQQAIAIAIEKMKSSNQNRILLVGLPGSYEIAQSIINAKTKDEVLNQLTLHS